MTFLLKFVLIKVLKKQDKIIMYVITVMVDCVNSSMYFYIVSAKTWMVNVLLRPLYSGEHRLQPLIGQESLYMAIFLSFSLNYNPVIIVFRL
jgi:hypothetical protein